jgi:anhydro-N-acetylmuramic acid kinase
MKIPRINFPKNAVTLHVYRLYCNPVLGDDMEVVRQLYGGKTPLRIVGLMSGTSADGIDAAIIDYGNNSFKVLAFETFAYPSALKKSIFKLFNPDTARIEDICNLNFAIGEVFAHAVLDLCKKHKISLKSIDLIGSHGQTIYHNPKGTKFGKSVLRSTLQIGEPCVIAQRTGIATIADFRTADIAGGGQGAPLVPFADYILFADKRKNRVIQNIGGIANLTWLPAGGMVNDIIAFDTGPGNMVIDAIVNLATNSNRAYDAHGRLAAKGTVDESLLKKLMKHKFLQKKPPKTTGREEFGRQFTKRFFHGRNYADLAATATAFTAKSIADAYKRFLPGKVDEVILCGGGSRNPILVKMLKEYASPAQAIVMDDLGINADAKEAISFAILAAHTVMRIPNNVPSATGAKEAVVLGKIILPQPQ